MGYCIINNKHEAICGNAIKIILEYTFHYNKIHLENGKRSANNAAVIKADN